MSTQTLERGICFYTYKAALLRAARDEAGGCSDSASPSGLLHAGCPEELIWNPFSCYLSAGCVEQHHPGLQHAPGLPLYQPCPLLSSVLQWARSLQLGHSKLQREEWPRSLCLSPERKSIPFHKPLPHIIGGIFHLSDKTEDSCSLLLLSWVYVAKISPSCLNMTASTGQHKST